MDYRSSGVRPGYTSKRPNTSILVHMQCAAYSWDITLIIQVGRFFNRKEHKSDSAEFDESIFLGKLRES